MIFLNFQFLQGHQLIRYNVLFWGEQSINVFLRYSHSSRCVMASRIIPDTQRSDDVSAEREVVDLWDYPGSTPESCNLAANDDAVAEVGSFSSSFGPIRFFHAKYRHLTPYHMGPSSSREWMIAPALRNLRAVLRFSEVNCQSGTNSLSHMWNYGGRLNGLHKSTN